MHTYTAEEVVRETQGWPRGIGLSWGLHTDHLGAQRLVSCINGAHIPAETAAHAAIGAGLVWLLNQREVVSETSCAVGDASAHVLLFNIRQQFRYGITPLAAVSAAVRWVMEQQKGATK